ncbi:MAG: DNA-directed RNA polymerase, partial [Candidatus Diapherotrites archaeon]|nr:DNA-directed RNA polymerase [Candidatus Diapherotrites archaeon]
GKVIPGDGMIYYDSEIDMLVYKPELHEVMEGTVTEITEFGVFVRTGPIEGLIHRSQIMDDFTNYDQKTQTFVGRDTKKKIGMSEDVLVRTVSISLKGSLSNSKIGYTMRQVGLGKKEWLKTDSKKPQAKEKSATEEKEEKPAKSGKSANKKSEKKK